MFRRLPQSLPPDPKPPASLAEMGYFVSENDQIRMIQYPDRSYQFKIDRNDRVNEVHLAAMNDRIREIVQRRLSELGLSVLRLPIAARDTDPHVPTYISANLKDKKRVLVVFGSRDIDAGIFSFRTIGEQGINIGSAVSMVRAISDATGETENMESLGLVIANPGQLIWHRSGGKAIGHKEWLGLPRASAVHEPFRIDPVGNRIRGNANFAEHVQYMFEHVMNGQTHPGATFDIIGMEYTGMEVMHYLAAHWDQWNHKINGICLGNPQHTIEELQNISQESTQFLKFVKTRVRGYKVSDAPMETPVAGGERAGCNCYASGEKYYEDGILEKGWKSMLDWFNIIASIKDYEEPTFTLVEAEAEDGGAIDEAHTADVQHNQSW